MSSLSSAVRAEPNDQKRQIVVPPQYCWTGESKKKEQKVKRQFWNNSNTVLVIQRRGRVVTGYKNWQKVCFLVHYN